MINVKCVSCVGLLVFALLASTGIRAQQVTVFDSPGSPAVAPDGSIWVFPGDPPRLLRFDGDSFERISVQGPDWFDLSCGGRVHFAPYGQMWLEQLLPGIWDWSIYTYSAEKGLTRSDLPFPRTYYSSFIFFDPTERIYCKAAAERRNSGVIYRVCPDGATVTFTALILSDPLIIGSNEAWVCAWTPYWGKGDEAYRSGLYRIDLQTGEELANIRSDEYLPYDEKPLAVDDAGRLWFWGAGRLFSFDGSDFQTLDDSMRDDEFCEGLWMTTDGTIWTILRGGPFNERIGVRRFRDGSFRTFTSEDGISSNDVGAMIIDYDGNVWLSDRIGAGLTRISDGGWPQMRLALNKLETPEAIAIVASVFNTQPVVGVDVYIACQIGASLLFYPNWMQEPSPIQINLYAGFNQSATIIEMPKASIPPGSYTFWGCMTGRGTQKLIGPLDRKFETLRIEVNEGN